MSLLSKIQELLSIWFPNKTQDQTNYNNWMNEIPYVNGKLGFTTFYQTDIVTWSIKTSGNDSFKVSDYYIPLNNYSVEFKVSALNFQLAVGDETGWVFACNVGKDSNQLYTHNPTGTGTTTYTNMFKNTVIGDIIKVNVSEANNTVYAFVNGVSKGGGTYKTTGFPKNIRIYTSTDANKIEYIRIKPLE